MAHSAGRAAADTEALRMSTSCASPKRRSGCILQADGSTTKLLPDNRAPAFFTPWFTRNYLPHGAGGSMKLLMHLIVGWLPWFCSPFDHLKFGMHVAE
jgi:hypothetical protein